MQLTRLPDQLPYPSLPSFQLKLRYSCRLCLRSLILRKLLLNCRRSLRIYAFHCVNMSFFQTIFWFLNLKRASLALGAWESILGLLQIMLPAQRPIEFMSFASVDEPFSKVAFC
ncbi:unnamed protein product [Lathyrus sativus]|nr:unnamed protein product [Lathyrus sativus]